MMDNLERSELFFDFVDTQRRYTRGQDWLDEVSRTMERMETLGMRFRSDPAFTSQADATQDVIDSLKTLRYELAETVQAQKERMEALVGDLRMLIFIGDDV